MLGPTDAPAVEILDGPTIVITGEDDHVVIHLTRRVDYDSTVALGQAIESALLSGTTVVMDLEPRGPSDATVPAGDPVGHRRRSIDGQRAVFVDGCGCIRLGTPGSWWTIDVHAGRLLRSSDPVERRFAGPASWIDIRELRVSDATVSALTTDGSLLSMSRRVSAA